MGELHLEILVDRMKREFGVEANVVRRRLLTAKPSPRLLPTCKVSTPSSPVVRVSTVIVRLLWSRLAKVRLQFIDEIKGGDSA
jgi:predicted membrane GTPase involved in stress response